MPEVPDAAKEADKRAATLADRLAARVLVVVRLRGGAR
jgi:hypothetical protein